MDLTTGELMAKVESAELSVALHASKPRLGLPDPLAAAQEEARLAKEGNQKLCAAVDTLRAGLETIVTAEWDRSTQSPVTAPDLRRLAVETLNAYSQLTGQSWRRNPLVGSRAGDRDTSTLEQ